MTLNQLQDFYKQTIKTNTGAGAGNIYVSTKPNVANGYLVISPTNASLRELIRYTGTGSDGGGDYVTIANISDRGLGGTVAQVHTAGESIRMNMTAEHWADLITELTTLTSGFIEKDAPYNEVQDIIDYINNIAIAGAPDASTSTKGIVEIATDTEINNGTATGSTGAVLSVTPDKLATSKYNKFKTTPSDTNKVLTQNEVYTDGVSAEQLLSNASIKFGETDTAGKNNKIYQSFIAGKDTIKSILFKKETNSLDVINYSSDGSSYSYSNGGSGYYQDDGVVSGARKMSVIAGNYMNTSGTLSKVMTGLTIGKTYYLAYNLTYNTTGTNGYVRIDSTQLDVMNTNRANANYVFSFVATATSHTVYFELKSGSSITYAGDMSVKEISFYSKTTVSDIYVKIFASNAGLPTGSALSSETISSTLYNSLDDGALFEVVLSSTLNVVRGDTYWLEFSQNTGSDTLYPNLSYQNTTQTGFNLKKWNTSDGFVAITGALYMKVKEDDENKLAIMDNIIKMYNIIKTEGHIYSTKAFNASVIDTTETIISSFKLEGGKPNKNTIIKLKSFYSMTTTNSANPLYTLRLYYKNTVISSITVYQGDTTNRTYYGYLEGIIQFQNSLTNQTGFLMSYLSTGNAGKILDSYGSGLATVDSSNDETIKLTIQFSDSNRGSCQVYNSHFEIINN